MPTDDTNGLGGDVESVARAIADARYHARLDVIAASQSTDRPISCPGPFDGMDYLIPAEQWDRASDSIRDPYRADARAALAVSTYWAHVPDSQEKEADTCNP